MDISQIKKGKDKIDDFMDWKEDYEDFRKKLDKTKKNRDEFFEEMIEEKGIKEIQKLSDKIRNEKLNNNNIKNDCVRDLRKATGIMFTDRQRVTIKERVTVREDSIWKYGRSQKAGFGNITGGDGRTSIYIAREIRDTDARSRFMEGVELIDNIPDLTKENCVEIENRIDNINAIEVNTNKQVKFKEDSESSYKDRFSVNDLSSTSNYEGERNLEEARISYLLVHKEDIIEAQKELLETMREEKKQKQKIREKIEYLFQKELTIDEF